VELPRFGWRGLRLGRWIVGRSGTHRLPHLAFKRVLRTREGIIRRPFCRKRSVSDLPGRLVDQRALRPKYGRNRVPSTLPANAVTPHTQPCTLAEAIPLKYPPMLQP
jgi:hypothetical protein